MYGFLLSSHARCCRISSGSCLTVHVDAIVSCLSLVDVCSAFCSLDWVVMGYLLLLVIVMLIGYNRVQHVATVVLSGMRCTLCLSVLPLRIFAQLRQQHVDLFTSHTDTMRSFFAQQHHLGMFHYVVDCLDLMSI